MAVASSVKLRPKVKICGITSVADARLAVALGADFLGLNFYPPSPRFLSLGQAAEIAAEVRQLASSVELVGVFVHRPADEVEEIARVADLDLLQFHGDESAADLAPFAERAIKVLRINNEVEASELAAWSEVWGLLIDTRHPRLFGGTGETWRFESLQQAPAAVARIFIAGGLGPRNIRQAILASRPWGIDLCSGVEARPGKKDPELMRQLFEEIRHVEESSIMA